MNPFTWTCEGSKGNLYRVTLSTEGWHCECPARKEECRHVVAIRQLQKLALLDKAAVDTLEQLAKAEEQRQQPEPAPKSMSAKEKLDIVWPEELFGEEASTSRAARDADERMGTLSDLGE